VDGNARTNPYVYVNALTVAPGGGNTMIISSVKNLSAPQVPLISFISGSASFDNLVMPAGLHGSLILNGSELDLLITLSTNNLVWRGYSSANWNLSDTNWLDLATGLHTNFHTGDSVTFDDAAGVPTTINVSDPVIVPTKFTMTNTVNYYTFNGSGAIQGGATLAKTGTNVVQMDASSTVTVQVNQGQLLGSGQIGAANVSAGASMNFAGTIINGVTCAGTATISGNGNGTITLLAGGSLSQLGTFNGSFTMAPGSLLNNQGTINNLGSPTVTTNATFINSGNLTGTGLTVGGTYVDTGGGQLTFSNVTTINGNGTFLVGNADGGSQVIINNGGTSVNSPQRGRVLFANGSTNIFGVNTDNGNANQLISYSIDFGNNNTFAGGGGVILITNVGTSSFAAGQNFWLFQNNQDIGNPSQPIFESGTNTAPVIRPPAPGPGLAWDTRTLRQDGHIKVISVGTSLPAYGFSPVITNNLILFLNFTTNITGGVTNINANYSTNKAIITTLNWPATNVGWRLQEQIDQLDVGIRGGDSNWTYVYPSWWTNTMYVTNTFNPTNATFFRLTYP